MEQLKAPSSPEVQQWLKSFVDAVYNKTDLPKKEETLTIPPSVAGLALLEAFPARLVLFRDQFPPEFKKDQRVAIFVLTRALVAWQDQFSPDPQDWLNMRTNMGYIQQQNEVPWRELFDGERPSMLSWLNDLPAALGYELSEKQADTIKQQLKRSTNATPRFWGLVQNVWAQIATEHSPESITDYLALARGSIEAAKEMQKVLLDTPGIENIDALPSFLDTQDAFTLAVPARDYQKGWDYFVRTTGREFALKRANSFYPDGVPDNPNDRVAHIKLVDEHYDMFERSLEPWRWPGLIDASFDEQAQTWAWLTGWAPEYNWDTAVKNMGVHPPVEAIGREYTGQSTQWWLTSSFNEKIQAANAWLETAQREMADSRKEGCNMNEFVANMLS